MKLQKWVIEKYINLTGLNTLNDISKDTGIQITRVFRLIHGKEMKLKEFEIFQSKIFKNLKKSSSILSLINECLLKLGDPKLEEIDETLRRALLIWELKKKDK